MTDSDRNWIASSIDEAIRPFAERAATVDKKKQEDDETERRRDQAYLDDWPLSFLLGSFKVVADGSYTNVDEWKGGPGLSASSATEIDEDTILYGVQVGWSSKPILRDIWLLTDERNEKAAQAAEKKSSRAGSDPADHPSAPSARCPQGADDAFRKLAQYRCWKKNRGPDSWKRWALLDAFKLTAGGRFGTVVDDPSGEENSTTSQEGSYFVGISYELPLENFRSPFIE